MMILTPISVRALAYGGKFIGKAVNFAKIDIYNTDTTKPIASGIASEGYKGSGDGSGITALIMGQAYPWGYPVTTDLATEFFTEIKIDKPTILTFVATSIADPTISVSVKRLVIPGIPLIGAMAVVMVVPGLLVNIMEPATPKVVSGTATPITAQVRMMCGCKIENLFWPVANFTVEAVIQQIEGHNHLPQTLILNYTGQPSLFSASYTFDKPGTYEISVRAIEMNGNLGHTTPFQIVCVANK